MTRIDSATIEQMGGLKRALSFHEVRECEFALKPVCKCRCQGRFHGAKRMNEDAGEDDYRGLPREDPHHLLTRYEAKEAAKARAYIRDRHRSRWGTGHHAPEHIEFIQTISLVRWNGRESSVIEFPCPLCSDEGRDPKMEDREVEPT